MTDMDTSSTGPAAGPTDTHRAGSAAGAQRGVPPAGTHRAGPVRHAGPEPAPDAPGWTGQPYLHDRVVCLAAPAVWLSGPDGQVGGGVDGLYLADRRVLSRLEVRIAGAPPAAVAGALADTGTARFVGVVRGAGDPSPDPTVTCERRRRVTPQAATETITVRNQSRRTVITDLSVAAGVDLAVTADVKSGQPPAELPPATAEAGLTWNDTTDGISVRLTADPPPSRTDPSGQLWWGIDLQPGARATLTLTVTVDQPARSGFRPLPASAPAPWTGAPLTVTASDRRLENLVRRSVDDLTGLLLGDPEEPRDGYFAAGAPWYMTLFGRDSLWAARMALPLGWEVAASTLRILARRQGTTVDRRTGEAPGKIPHELRSPDAAVWLPEVYYGTVDATPLFVVTLAEAWRWGMPAEQVASLLPAAERALDWLRGDGDPDGDGFIEYDADHAGLSNQGWKDSHDGVQWADGRVAGAPLALCEVQGYAYQAATAGADLLDAFGRPGGDRWRQWAADLAHRFRAAYWVSDRYGNYPAIALDGDKRPVTGPTSNIGHLLGTGLLDAAEESTVADLLGGPALDSGYGLRTLAASVAGFNPLSYHAGSVWPHDTAIAVWGLTRAGRVSEAARLCSGLLAAASHFEYRLPELFGGEPRDGVLPPTPYPASCRPQAWAAAAAPVIVRALLGLEPDVPAGRVRLRPTDPTGNGYQVTGIRLGDGTLAVTIDPDGAATVRNAPAGITVEIAP